MNVIITIPPVRDFYYTPHRGSFLGTEIVKRILEKNGLNVKLLNLINLKSKPKKINLPDYLGYLNHYLKRGLFFKSFKHFGLSFEKSADFILKHNPDAVIISCFAFCYSEEAISLAKQLKKKKPDLYLVIGGSGVTVYPDFFVNTDLFNLIIAGEFETVYLEVVDFLKNKKSGTIIGKENCSSENMEFVIKDTLKTNKISYFSTILSRGCPKGCKFCSNFLVFGKKFKVTPLEKIELELKKMKFYSKKIFLNFEDDNILFNKEYLWEVLNLFKKYFSEVKFSFENGIDYLLLNIEDVEKLIKLGMRQFNFSFVNLNQKILNNSNRDANKEKLAELINFIKKSEIPVITYIIAGLKQDCFENVLENLFFLFSLKTIIGYSAFYPVPGIFKISNEVPPGLLRGSSMFPWNKSLSTEELIKGFEIARALNLSNNKLQ